MVMAIAPLLLLMLGQGDALFGSGDLCVPADVNTYEVFEGGVSKGFGGVRYRGEEDWLADNTPKVVEMREHKLQVEVVYDRPWDPVKPETLTLTSRCAFTIERRSARLDRLKTGWANAGYVVENGVYVRAQELEKIRTALAMAAQAAQPPAQPVLTGAETLEGTASPGLVRQFWLHALILVGGAALLAALVRAFFL